GPASPRWASGSRRWRRRRPETERPAPWAPAVFSPAAVLVAEAPADVAHVALGVVDGVLGRPPVALGVGPLAAYLGDAPADFLALGFGQPFVPGLRLLGDDLLVEFLQPGSEAVDAASGVRQGLLGGMDDLAVAVGVEEVALEPSRADAGVAAAGAADFEPPVHGAVADQALPPRRAVRLRIGRDAVFGAGLGVVVVPAQGQACGAIRITLAGPVA